MNTKPITKPAALGRGLSALFGDADTSYQARPVAATAAPAREKNGALTVAIEWLQPGVFQPRRHFDDAMLKGLADSIRERGILQPLLVRAFPNEKDSYEIIAGERRWRAAQLAGLHEVPVVVRTISDREALEMGVIENVQRQDLSPLEEAAGYKRLIEEFQHTQDGLAKIIGKSRPHITNMLRLLSLPDAVKTMIEKGELTMAHARAIAAAKNPTALAQEIIKHGLNVRQAESLAKRQNENPARSGNAGHTLSVDADILALEKELHRVVGLRVKIEASTKADDQSGSITLYYKDLEQLDGVIRKLKN